MENSFDIDAKTDESRLFNADDGYKTDPCFFDTGDGYKKNPRSKIGALEAASPFGKFGALAPFRTLEAIVPSPPKPIGYSLSASCTLGPPLDSPDKGILGYVEVLTRISLLRWHSSSIAVTKEANEKKKEEDSPSSITVTKAEEGEKDPSLLDQRQLQGQGTESAAPHLRSGLLHQSTPWL